MRSRLKKVVGLAIGAIFVYWFAHRLNWHEVFAQVRTANWAMLGLAVGLFVASYVVRALRWRALLNHIGEASLKALFRAIVVGFMAQFVMGRAAEMIVRPAVLSYKEKVRPSVSYATVMIERVFDMVMVVAFFAVNLLFFEYVSQDADAMRVFGWIQITGAVLLAVAVAGVYGLSVFRRRRHGALRFLEKRLGFLPRPVAAATISLLRHISEGLAVLHDIRSLAITTSFTVLMWFMIALAHVLIIRSFGISSAEVPFTGAVFMMGASMLGSVIPTPGGAAGPFHTVTAAALAFLGTDRNKAASVAILLHLLTFAPAIFFGLFYIIKDGLSLDLLKRIGERQVEEVDGESGQKDGEASEPGAEDRGSTGGLVVGG